MVAGEENTPQRPAAEKSPDASAQTLDPAIFLPFKVFYPGLPPVLGPSEELRKHIENVTAEQKIVRGNMVDLAQKQAKRLVSKAREELLLTKYNDDVEDALARKRRTEEADAFVESLKIPAKKDAKPQDFEVEFGREERANTTAKLATNGDAEMGGMHRDALDISKDRPPHLIRKDLSTSLRSLITSSTHQLEAYDTLSIETLSQYNRTLSGHSSRVVPSPPLLKGSPAKSPTVKLAGVEAPTPIKITSTKTSANVQSIPKKRTAECRESPKNPKMRSPRSPIDQTRRMSTGMPVSGLKPMVEPVRVVESLEELARRGRR